MGDAGLFQMDLQRFKSCSVSWCFCYVAYRIPRFWIVAPTAGCPVPVALWMSQPVLHRHGPVLDASVKRTAIPTYEDPAEGCSVDYAHSGPLRHCGVHVRASVPNGRATLIR